MEVAIGTGPQRQAQGKQRRLTLGLRLGPPQAALDPTGPPGLTSVSGCAGVEESRE